MINKRGSKYTIIRNLILGLLVLGFFVMFVYQEYWSSDNANLEACRESVQLRASLPESTVDGITVTSFKKNFPLKCKTSVVDINKKDVEDGNYKDIIAGKMAECWHLFGNGKLDAFPSKFLTTATTCVSCARIHFTDDAKDYILKNNIKINIRNSLDERMPGQRYSYLTYLNKSGGAYSAFNPGASSEFDLSGKKFIIDIHDRKLAFRNFAKDIKISKVYLPEYFYPNEGDLLINYGILTLGGEYNPYLFYFQQGQKTPSPFDEVGNLLYTWSDTTRLWNVNYANFCESWDGIPA